MSDAAEVSSWCQEMDGYTRSRWERCRTPMGTVPLSVIHGFDYTVCEISPGLLKYIFFVLRFCNLISYYFILVQSLIKNTSTYSTEATTKRRSLLWPESFAAKVLFLSIISIPIYIKLLKETSSKATLAFACNCSVERSTTNERQSNSQVRRPSPPLFSSRPVTRGYSRPYVMGARASVGPSHASSPRTARRAKTVAPSMSTSPHLGQTHTR